MNINSGSLLLSQDLPGCIVGCVDFGLACLFAETLAPYYTRLQNNSCTEHRSTHMSNLSIFCMRVAISTYTDKGMYDKCMTS